MAGILLFLPALVSAQTFYQISAKYSCAFLSTGESMLLLNGESDGEYAITQSAKELKSLKSERAIAKERIAKLKEIKGFIRSGDFDRKDKNFINKMFTYIIPATQPELDSRSKRIAAADQLIEALQAQIQDISNVIISIQSCNDNERPKRKYGKYGSPLPVFVKPIIIQGSASWNYREGYYGYLLTTPRIPIVRDSEGRKVGTRTGLLMCVRNADDTTPGGIYRIFDDQPCQESEGGVNGGNTSLPFADLTACSAAVGSGNWGSFGTWHALSYPSQDQLQAALNNLVAQTPPFYEAVVYDLIAFAPSVSLDKFKSWCANEF